MERSNSGFYIIDAFSLRQASKKPFHLEQRFVRNNNNNSTLEEAEIKREALLQDRREKLNRRFLAVQQVAKDAKARRESQRLLFMQSLQVAELKRQHHIEQRRMASKELVERAKVIARQNTLRYEAKQERLRKSLQTRLEQSHARRLHLLTQPKSRILVTASTAATQVFRKRAAAFRELGLPSSSRKETWLQFNQLVNLLRSKRVIQVASKVLSLALPDKDCKRKARVLLSAYMMLTCPREVFQDMDGTEEQQLVAAAKELLRRLEQWLDSNDSLLTRVAFEECWNNYYALFESWKSKDTKQLIANMSTYCLELVRLKHSLGEQGQAEGVDKQLEQQIEQVKDRIKSLGGTDAVEQLVEAEKAMENLSITDESFSRSVPPSPTPRHERASPSTQEPITVISPEQIARLLGGFAPASGVSNEQLAHEIILDPDFQLKKPEPQSELEERVRTIATQAFFDRVQEELDDGHPEKSLPMLLNDVRERLLSLVPPNSALHANISEGIDIALIEQQIQQGVFDLPRMLQYVLDTMRQMCAPVRDETIRTIQQRQDSPVQQLRGILELLDDMALDLANYRLRALRPHLAPIAIEYEQKKFAEALRQNAVGLAKTRNWLQKAMQKLEEAAEQRNPENVNPDKNNRPRPDAVFEEAFISLLKSPEPLTRLTCPETFLLDVDRMVAFQNETQAVTIVAALIMFAKGFGYSGDLEALARKLFVMLDDGSTTLDNLSAELERSLPVSEERKALIRSMVEKTLKHTDTVYSLLVRRVASVIRSQLQTGRFATREVLMSYGLEHVSKRLQRLCNRLYILVRHHRQVYSIWYDNIIADLRQS